MKKLLLVATAMMTITNAAMAWTWEDRLSIPDATINSIESDDLLVQKINDTNFTISSNSLKCDQKSDDMYEALSCNNMYKEHMFTVTMNYEGHDCSVDFSESYYGRKLSITHSTCPDLKTGKVADHSEFFEYTLSDDYSDLFGGIDLAFINMPDVPGEGGSEEMLNTH